MLLRAYGAAYDPTTRERLMENASPACAPEPELSTAEGDRRNCRERDEQVELVEGDVDAVLY